MVVGFLGLGVGGQINIADIPVVSFCADTLSDWHLNAIENQEEAFRREADLDEGESFDPEARFVNMPSHKQTRFSRMAETAHMHNNVVSIMRNYAPQESNFILKHVSSGIATLTILAGTILTLPHRAITQLTAEAHLRRLRKEEDEDTQNKLIQGLKDLHYGDEDISMMLGASVTRPKTSAAEREKSLQLVSQVSGLELLYSIFQESQEANPDDTQALETIALAYYNNAMEKGPTISTTGDAVTWTVKGVIITEPTLKSMYQHLPEDLQTEFKTLLTIKDLSHTGSKNVREKLNTIARIDIQRKLVQEKPLSDQICTFLRRFITSSIHKGHILPRFYGPARFCFQLLHMFHDQGRTIYIELLAMISPHYSGRISLLQNYARRGIQRNDALWGVSFSGCGLTALELDAALYNIASPDITGAFLYGEVTTPQTQPYPITDNSLHQLVKIYESTENDLMRDYAASRLAQHTEREEVFNVLKFHLLSGREERTNEIALALAKENIREAAYALAKAMERGTIDAPTTVQLIENIFENANDDWGTLGGIWDFLIENRTRQSPALFQAIASTQFTDTRLERKRQRLLTNIIIGRA